MSDARERCFACDKKLSSPPEMADTRDGQIVYVGRDCARKIRANGERGYQPPKGGPKLYPMRGDVDA